MVSNKKSKIWLFQRMRDGGSVTRFGEIPPLWQNYKTLGQLFEGFVIFGQIFETTLANLLYCLANFH